MTQFDLFHWLVVFAIVVLLFGGKRLPEIMRRLGDGPRGGPPTPRGGPPTPTHPLPVTGPIETSRGAGDPDKPANWLFRPSRPK
jgi:TatA/E family protein of Tat protein translocase